MRRTDLSRGVNFFLTFTMLNLFIAVTVNAIQNEGGAAALRVELNELRATLPGVIALLPGMKKES